MEKNDRRISIMNQDETIQRLHEIGYYLSKFGNEKTWKQEEIMEFFRVIIEGDKDEPKRS